MTDFCLGQNDNYVVHIDHFTVGNGLGSNHIIDCFQDSRGMIWLVREGGIERFDGEEFKHFSSPELKNTPDMSFLLEDKDHDLWIRRNNKTIVFLNIFTEKLRTSEDKFGPTFPKEVNWAVQGVDNSFLLQDAFSNIYRYYPGQTPTLYYSTPGKIVSPLVEYSNATAWSECNNDNQNGFMVATDRMGKEIVKIGYDQYHIYGKGEWGGDTIHYLTKDSFFLATFQGIVLKKSLKSMAPGYEFNDPYRSGQFQKVVVEQDRGLVWVYLPFQLMVFDKSLKLLYTFDSQKYFVQSSTVFDLFIDNQNHAWLCTFDGLYNINFKPNPFKQFLAQNPSNKEAYKPVSVRKMCMATDGNVYVVASPYLYKVAPDGTIQQDLRIPNIEGVDLAAFDADNKGNIWYSNKYLYKYNVYNRKLDKYLIGRKYNWYTKYQDNQVWCGFPMVAISGLEGTPYIAREYAVFDSLDRLDIYQVLKISDREYFIASDRGLYTLDPVTGQYACYWENGVGEYYFPSSNIRHIHQDKQGDFWLATTDGMVYWRRSTGEKRLYAQAEGLPTYCNAVLEDEKENLWISSNFGLVRFDKKTGRTRTFLVSDGLPSDEFNRLSYLKNELTGEMYLGGINGFIKFHPRDLYERGPDITESANLVLTECLIFSGQTNKEEDIREDFYHDNQIDIYPGDLFLRIKFAVTDYTKPIGIKYAYLIEGYNKNWHTGAENELLLSGLPYGNYTLHVKALSPSGLPYEKEMRIPIHVYPPLYLRKWFLALSAILAVLGVMWYIKWRTRMLTERSAELEKVVSERTEVIERQRKSLKELYDSKSRLYANITHEFRTPLTMIIGPAQRILKKDELRTQPEIQQNLQHILHNSEQLLSLVNQMLDLNKLESKAMKPDYFQADIVPFLEQVMEKFRSYAVHKDLRFNFTSEVKQLRMDYDPGLLEKVVNNLLSNAVKFTPQGGAVEVLVKKLENQFCLEIKDSGIGIEPEKLPFIFERYYQADGSPTRRSEGTGIGLALVKELVDLFEGKIQVTSIPDRETIFTLVLPIRNNAPLKELSENWSTQAANLELPVDLDPLAGEEPFEPAGKPSIIIIEDNASVAAFAASCLSEFYQVQTITDSRLGLAAVQEQLPDLVISDLMMPDMDGYEVCKAIKTDERTSHIPVIFLSAVTEQADRLKRLSAGADAYISKPFSEDELQTVVAQLLLARVQLRNKFLAMDSGDAQELVSAEEVSTIDMEFLNKVRDVIREHLDQPEFDGNELARKIGFSTSQLHRKLTALTGLPAGRYIYQIRLGIARDMLKRKDLSISEVAYQTGFSDPAYFTKLFTKTFGQSPRKYRSEESEPG
ncbi:MAG TPA: ATP-binding protein [Saprospiraceae bacterium]|nr:ATP-binding protein [Saprospiraceae bacterium]